MNSTERHEARYQRRKAARIEKKAKALKEFGDFGAVFSFDHLYASYRASIKGVGWKASTQRYKSSALAHIAKTQEELLTGKYRSRGFYEFDLVERGKPRHIRSVHISERVVQRCLCDYCLVPALSKSFIYDNGASLPGKGYDFAVSRVTRFLADHYRRYGNEGYALIFDFSKYFDTAHHEPIFEQFRRSGIDGNLVRLSEYFISNFGDVGLGLGSQVSQIAALALPNKIDHFIKDVLRMKQYVRYMDDGCIIDRSKKQLENCLHHLRRLCAAHGIRLNEKKTQIIKLTRGFSFVKVRFRYGRTGKIVRKATYQGVRHMMQKLKIFRRWVDRGRMAAADVAASVTSWLGHMRRFHSTLPYKRYCGSTINCFREVRMDYITYKRYKGSGIGGYFNIRHGTKVTENGGFLHAPDGRGICAVTSEDGWEHFRPDTLEGAYRQKLLDKLYRFYISGKGDAAADFTAERFPDADNYYWKNLLRTMPTPKLTAFYSARLGQPPKMEG